MSETLSGGGLFLDIKPWLIVGFSAIVVSVLFWLPLVRRITRSISQMTDATEQVAGGHFDILVPEGRSDELGRLGQAINRMTSRLKGFVTGQKRFLGDVAHELCSPLARIQVGLGILEQRADKQQQTYVADVRDEIQHISTLVNELLSFSKASLGASTIQLSPLSVCELARRAIEREKTDGAEIRLDIEDDLRVMAEPELLLRSLSNLLRNAIRYAGQAGPVTISARADQKEAVLIVSDCGPGVPESELARIFDPFYRVDASRDLTMGGVGLGLTIVKRCIESCNGTVTCRNRQPSGLEVTLRLPAI
jgi:two-component system sensor histidine kinase CpxA